MKSSGSKITCVARYYAHHLLARVPGLRGGAGAVCAQA